MVHPLQSAYELYENKLKIALTEVKKCKTMLNELAKEMGINVPYPDFIEEDNITSTSISVDEFVGKSPTVAVSEYLTKRTKAASWLEITEALNRGGFEWKRFGDTKKVRTTVLKNTTTFKYIKANDAFGLKKWYRTEKKENVAENLSDNEIEKKIIEEEESEINSTQDLA